MSLGNFGRGKDMSESIEQGKPPGAAKRISDYGALEREAMRTGHDLRRDAKGVHELGAKEEEAAKSIQGTADGFEPFGLLLEEREFAKAFYADSGSKPVPKEVGNNVCEESGNTHKPQRERSVDRQEYVRHIGNRSDKEER